MKKFICTCTYLLIDRFIFMMKKVNSEYSIKNIPIASERISRYLPKEYPDTFRKNILITVNGKSRNGNRKNEMKAIHFNNNDSTDNNIEDNTEWYGLKSPYSSKQVKELIPFKNN